MILKIYLLIFHFLTGIFFSGGVIIAMTSFFSVKWAQIFKDLAPLWKKSSYLVPVLFVPLIIFSKDLLPMGEMKGHRALYYENWFIILRATLISVAAVTGARLLGKLPVAAIILFFVSGTFVSVDWGMGLEAHWASNIYGLIWLVMFAYAFFAIISAVRAETLGPKDRKDLTHVLITLAIMWGYLQYSQFIILWMGNKPDEVTFYLNRHFPMGLMVLVLILKLVPVLSAAFFPAAKEKALTLKLLGGTILLGTAVEIVWLLGSPLGMSR